MNRRPGIQSSVMAAVTSVVVICGGVRELPQALAQPVECDDPLDKIEPFCPVSERLSVIGSRVQKVVLGDVDGDGDDDAVSLHSGAGVGQDGKLQVHLNTCVGDYYEEPLEFVDVPFGAGDILLADLDGDERPDVVIRVKGSTSDPTHRLYIMYNDGTGQFDTSETITLSSAGGNSGPADFDTSDLDEDGDIDICVVGQDDSTVDQDWIWIA